MIKIFIQNKNFYSEIEYVFDIFMNRLGIKYEHIQQIDNLNDNDILINYGKKEVIRKKTLNIIENSLFDIKLYGSKESIPGKIINKYNNIPIIYGDENIATGRNYVSTNIDIIQSSFFMLTRYEEYVLWDSIGKDMFGRYAAKDSLAYKEGFLSYPIVDEYIELLWRWMIIIGYEKKRRRYFENYDFAVCLTHDVDIPFKYRNSLIDELKKLKNTEELINQYKEIIKHTKTIVNYKCDPYYTFNYIRNIEKKYNFNSSFYFMSGGTTKHDNFYSINDKRIIKLINDLEKDGCEIGYHYSYNAYDNLEMKKLEKRKLENIYPNIYGGRNHFLRFTPKSSLKSCEKVGLKYDSTLCYADYIGFRCGTCFPYKIYDLSERRKLELFELPLIIMEGTLNENKYMNLNCEEAFEEIKKKIDIVKKYNGVFTMLWHNSSFNNDLWKGWENVFEKTMLYLNESNAVGMSGIEVIRKIEDKYEKNINI